MNKRLIFVAVLICIIVALSACSGKRIPDTDTTPFSDTKYETDTHISDDTDNVTESETELNYGPEPLIYNRDDPRLFLKGWSLDTLEINGVPYFDTDGQIDTQLSAIHNTISLPYGSEHDSVSFYGWVGFEQAIYRFGYSIDDAKAVFGNFTEATDSTVKSAGGMNATRFLIDVPLKYVGSGSHTVSVLAALADGKTVSLLEITVVVTSYELDDTLPHHCSLETINKVGRYGNAVFESRGSSSLNGKDGSLDIIDSFVALSSDFTVQIQGWNALDGGVAKYVWSTDGFVWYDCIDLGTEDGFPTDKPFSEIGLPNAPGTKALFRIGADLTAYNGLTVSVTFAAVSLADESKLQPMVQLSNVKVPRILNDIANPFTSDVSAQNEGTDLRNSDLAAYFTFEYGVSEPHEIQKDGSEKYYAFGGINAMYTDVNGKNAFTVDFRSADATSLMFTRGVHAVYPIDTSQVQFVLTNYYETDGQGYMGGAGIWGFIKGDVLALYIKFYDVNSVTRVNNKIYTFKISGSKLTFADDGMTVHVLVDGKLITEIKLSGETMYNDIVRYPEVFMFAEKAEILLANGKTDVIHNTLVASEPSQIGISVRPEIITFRSVSVLPFSAVTIPNA